MDAAHSVSELLRWNYSVNYEVYFAALDETSYNSFDQPVNEQWLFIVSSRWTMTTSSETLTSFRQVLVGT